MDERVEAPPVTALEPPSLPPRPNQFFQGVLSFLAVVGIGSAATLALHPPVRLRVVTVEKRVAAPPPQARVEEAKKKLLPAPPMEKKPFIKPDHRPQLARGVTPAQPMPRSDDCHDPLCGLGDLKR